MNIIGNPELKGKLAIVFIIMVLGVAFAAMSGKLEQWFNITWFSGPRAYDKIVFVSDATGKNEIYIIDPDGKGRKQLTQGANVQGTPAVNPSANRIVFVADYQNKEPQIYSVRVDGENLEQLTSATGPKKSPAFSPDGKRLSYIASGKVYVADINGDDPSVVLPGHEDTHAAISARGDIPAYTDYAWTPDNQGMIGVTRSATDNDMLVFMPQLKGETVPLHLAQKGRVRIMGLSWAIDKPLLAITAQTGKNALIAIYDAQRKAANAAPLPGKIFGSPAFAPDGSAFLIAFAPNDPKANPGLMKISLEGDAPNIFALGLFQSPVFSPTGDRIAVTVNGYRSGGRDVAVMEPESGKAKKITSDGKSFSPVWTSGAPK